MKRILNISTGLLDEAIQDKYRLESLAFAMQLKGVFISGALHNRNQSDLKALFRMGNDKLTRLINNGLKFGYLRQEGDVLIATPIRDEKRHIKLKLSSFNKVNSNLSIQKSLRKAYIVNHIRIIENLSHTFIGAEGETTPDNMRNRKKFQKQLSSYGVRVGSKVTGRLSYIRIAEILSISKRSAIQLINELVKEGVISKEYVFVEQDCYFDHSIEGDALYLANFNDSKGHLVRFVCPITGELSLYIQYSNKYSINKWVNYTIHNNYTKSIKSYLLS